MHVNEAISYEVETGRQLIRVWPASGAGARYRLNVGFRAIETVRPCSGCGCGALFALAATLAGLTGMAGVSRRRRRLSRGAS